MEALKLLYILLGGITATHCNTLQHTATHCNTLQHFIALYTSWRNRYECQAPKDLSCVHGGGGNICMPLGGILVNIKCLFKKSDRHSRFLGLGFRLLCRQTFVGALKWVDMAV